MLEVLRRQLSEGIFEKVVGPDRADHARRIHEAPGPRLFADDRPIRHVHADHAMFIGGLRALLLQSLHPLAMAAVAQHSDYRTDPWGRLQRTSLFLATTTFGRVEDAEKAVARLARVHRHIHGTAPDGREYRADDPHLLAWVHVAEVDSFLRCHRRYGAEPLDDYDGYVADMAVVAEAMGIPDPPRTTAELEKRLQSYRGELEGTPEAREAARFLLFKAPLPLLARGPYGILTATAVASLPVWARIPLRLPYLPISEATGVRFAGHALMRGMRWVTS
ncbi:oxygenase MpaB family protein [Lentzea sp. DG1S-22]|uniref:oxygenase MpaB family protein n=1 Tax=Lentzea sp. DG1S-22 TaxID=3108822 RepID=UPI002E79C3C9|nr:oxygenase MpaB family protein [Lentzea sp. DG1S-22]WVH83809.1 oxygenase MpaB family protein [Lentzea sp. DG1S-22]